MDPSPVFTNVETMQIEIIWKIFILFWFFFILYIFLITFICRNMLTLYLKFKNIVSVSELGSRIFWVHHEVQARLTNYYSWTEETQIIIYRLMNDIWGCVHTVFDSMVKWIWMIIEFIKVRKRTLSTEITVYWRKLMGQRLWLT